MREAERRRLRGHAASRVLAVYACVLVLAVAALVTVGVSAQPAPASSGAPVASASAAAPSASAVPSASSEPPPPPDPETLRLGALAAQVRALTAGDLEANVDPASLFDVRLDDEAAIAMETRRLALVIDAAEERARQKQAFEAHVPTVDADAGPTDAGTRRPTKHDVVPPSASASASAAAAPPPPPEPVPLEGEVDPGLWAARLDLDRARLAFLRQSPDERTRLLTTHAEKKSSIAKNEREIDDAERKAADAEAERKAALDAASRARTEALRLVGEERARLFGVAKAQAEFEAQLARARKDYAARAEATLAWQRRIRETVEGARAGSVSAAESDAVYDALRTELRAARERLGTSLDALSSDSAAPVPGPDPLGALPPDVDVSPAASKRREVEAESRRLRAIESEARIESARADFDEVETLNRARLALYSSLSPDKRAAITSFGPAGTDQARAEARQVSLVVRYHTAVTLRWFASVRTPGATRGQSAAAATLLALKWLLPIGLFWLWRRRARPILESWSDQLKRDRIKSGHVGRGRSERALGYFTRVRGPAEGLALVLAVVWLLPPDLAALLEVQLVRTALVWMLGGSFVIASIDALATESSAYSRSSRLQSAHVRLRSLRLIGLVVVGVGLLLSLSDELVGRGTIYSWVFSTAWFTAIPITILLVRWWRPIIFERVELKRKKSRLDLWVLRHKSGWRSLLPSLVGGVSLFGLGLFKAARTWISTFELTRRLLAYLFRRDISKRADELGKVVLGRLPDQLYDTLGPSTSCGEIVSSVADDEVTALIERINAAGGGVFALVGERGAGKSRHFERLREALPALAYLQCPFGGMKALSEVLGRDFELPAATALEELAARLDSESRDAGFLIDDAHRLVVPMIGGLADFDAVLRIARSSSQHCAWVFAFDEILWRFIERARGAQPLFDEVIHLAPWREEGIARLLRSRSKEAKISPSFAHPVENLPSDADEIDRQEAVERTAANYYRLIWDYSAGNPGVALHTWRRCLGVDPEGSIAVRVFRAPEVVELEELPHSAVFVVRAVVQLERALAEDVAQATMLSPVEIQNALRYGLLRGYFQRDGDRYAVSWAWYRPITRFLQRRHLLILGS